MPAVPKHRQPIVNTALTLFRRQGYSRTGLNEIVDVSGAPKGSLYHYFPLGKSSIAVATVTEAGRRVAATLTKLVKESRSTGEVVRRHSELLAGWMRASGFRDGCPITTVLLELAPGDRDVTEAGRSAYRIRVEILAGKLMADGFPKARADALAILCTSALQGALIQARVERSGRALEATATELARLLDQAAV